MELKPGELIRPLSFQRSSGFIDNEYARVDHTHDLDNEVMFKLSRNYDGNLVHNGQFAVSQRGFPTGIGSYPADRWAFIANGGVNANMTSIVANNAPGIYYASRATISTADTTMLTNDYLLIQQGIEGYETAETGMGTAAAKQLTLSFWARSSVAGTYHSVVRSQAADRSYVTPFYLEAGVWKLVVHSIPPCYDGTWAYNNNLGMTVAICLAGGPTFQTTPQTWVGLNAICTSAQVNFSATIGNTFDLTGVKLEVGPYTPFQPRRYAEELNICRRYLQVYRTPMLRGVITGATSAGRCGMMLSPPMRATPNFTATGTTNIWDGSFGGPITSTVNSYMSNQSVEHDFAMGGGGFIAGRPAIVYYDASGGIFYYSAEI